MTRGPDPAPRAPLPGAIIAAGSVVSADVPAYTMVAGNPAHDPRQRLDDATNARLLARAWWDWPAEKITATLDALRGADIDRLEALA